MAASGSWVQSDLGLRKKKTINLLRERSGRSSARRAFKFLFVLWHRSCFASPSQFAFHFTEISAILSSHFSWVFDLPTPRRSDHSNLSLLLFSQLPPLGIFFEVGEHIGGYWFLTLLWVFWIGLRWLSNVVPLPPVPDLTWWSISCQILDPKSSLSWDTRDWIPVLDLSFADSPRWVTQIFHCLVRLTHPWFRFVP